MKIYRKKRTPYLLISLSQSGSPILCHLFFQCSKSTFTNTFNLVGEAASYICSRYGKEEGGSLTQFWGRQESFKPQAIPHPGEASQHPEPLPHARFAPNEAQLQGSPQLTLVLRVHWGVGFAAKVLRELVWVGDGADDAEPGRTVRVCDHALVGALWGPDRAPHLHEHQRTERGRFLHDVLFYCQGVFWGHYWRSWRGSSFKGGCEFSMRTCEQLLKSQHCLLINTGQICV